MRTHAFKCPICGGSVVINLIICGEDSLLLYFKCRGCGRWTHADAADALEDAREYFDDELRRVEAGR